MKKTNEDVKAGTAKEVLMKALRFIFYNFILTSLCVFILRVLLFGDPVDGMTIAKSAASGLGLAIGCSIVRHAKTMFSISRAHKAVLDKMDRERQD